MLEERLRKTYRSYGMEPLIKSFQRRVRELPPGEVWEITGRHSFKPVTTRGPLADRIEFQVLLKVGDNITTDHISPAGAKYLPLRSNFPALAEHVFEGVDPGFAVRALESGPSAIVGGDNYGQGSSREHAAMCPLYLGIQAVLATSFARIHRANLINFGILPLQIARADYENLQYGDRLVIEGAHHDLQDGEVTLRNETQSVEIGARLALSERQREIMLAGGMLNLVRRQQGDR